MEKIELQVKIEVPAGTPLALLLLCVVMVRAASDCVCHT
jgi:hypothetical protein